MRKPFGIIFSLLHLFKNHLCDLILAFLSCKNENEKLTILLLFFLSPLVVLTDNTSCTVLALISGVSVTNIGFSMSHCKRFCYGDVSYLLSFLLKNSDVANWLPLTFLCCDMYI